MMKTIKSILVLLASFVGLQMMAITMDNDHLKYLGAQLSGDGNCYSYFYVNPEEGKTLTGLSIEYFDSAIYTNLLGEISLSAMIEDGKSIYEVVLPESVTVFRLKALYGEGDDQVTEYSYYYEAGTPYVYGSDISFTMTTGYGKEGNTDMAFEGKNTLQLVGNVYRKGFGTHAKGSVTFNITPGQYTRFASHAGKQWTQPASRYLDINLYMDNALVDSHLKIDRDVLIQWDYELTDQSIIKMEVDLGDGSNANDHGTWGGTRFYLPKESRREQTITWEDEIDVNAYRELTFTLDATSSSGLPVSYRILKGSDLVTMTDNMLYFPATKESGDVVVEAYQPGNAEWGIAPVKLCTYHVSNTCVVRVDETVTLTNDETIDELIDYNDGFNHTGQVQTEGMAQVGQLSYIYSFRQGVWNFLSFPTDVNIDEISNLNELGYTYNVDGRPSYYIKRYDGDVRALQEDSDEFVMLDTPDLEGMRGYLMMINNPDSDQPVDVTFNFENIWLKQSKLIQGAENFSVSFDFSTCEPGTVQSVYVRPKNVDGNILKIDVDFEPESTSTLPVNYSRAIREARVTYAPHYQGIRLTLPDSQVAKVAIYDEKGKKLIKAVNYMSPQLIDVSDFKAGNYNMYVSYGNAVGNFTFSIPKNR